MTYNKSIYFLLFIICGLTIAKVSNAQGLINNGGRIIITGSASVTVDGGASQGNFTNQDFSGTGTVENAGVLSVSGNWTNNSAQNVFITNTGTVYLAGTTQTIGGSKDTWFYNLFFTGTGTKTLDVNTLVGGGFGAGSGVLQLNTSNLKLNSHILTVNNTAATAITRTASSTSNMIISETDAAAGYGTIQWNIGTATGNYEFPLGNDATSNYLPFTFNKTTPGSVSGNGMVSISTYPTVTSVSPNNRSLPTGVTNLNNIFGVDNSENVVDRYWVLDVQNYSTMPVANITMTYRESEYDASAGSTNVISEPLLKAQRWDGTQWLSPVGTVNPGSNTLTVSSINFFYKVWTLVGSNNPLPIKLISFDANLNNENKVDLVWITETEINNDYFTIERSIDAVHFVEIGQVEGAGNSTDELHYSLVDENPLLGYSYYRLKQTDFDGTFTYSQIESIYMKDMNLDTGISVSVYPNPVTEALTVISNSDLAGASITIANAIGQQALQNMGISSREDRKVVIDVSSLARGVYFLRVERSGESSVTRFIRN